MIGGDGIAENAERTRITNVFDPPGLHAEVFEERRLVDVIAVLIPLVNFSSARRDLVPLRILRAEIAIEPLEYFRRERSPQRVADLLQRRPEIAQVNFFAVAVFA